MAEKRNGFTLIELLTVISIIALLAGLLIPLSGVASAKMRLARVNAELANYVTAIESYKLEVGSYPPDNGRLRQAALNSMERTQALAHSPLFYELSGAIFTNKGGSPIFRTVSTYEEISPEQLFNTFGVRGIQNSARAAADIEYKGMSFKETQFKELWVADPNADIELLAVPVPGPYMLEGRAEANPNGKIKFNPWFYDASSPHRRNRQGFDLWAEIVIGKKTNVIGNWKM